LRTRPAHSGHSLIASSLKLWTRSKLWPHESFVHAYW